MKRFSIFAALLLTLSINAAAAEPDPPVVKPSADRIVNIPQDMFKPERTISYCDYEYLSNSLLISLTCYGTGSETSVSIIGTDGEIIDSACIDSDVTTPVFLDVPQKKGFYYIIVSSDSFYGECRISIE